MDGKTGLEGIVKRSCGELSSQVKEEKEEFHIDR